LSYLLDTNVLSELRKPKPAAAVAHWFDQVTGPALFISVLAVGEVRQGIERIRPRDPGQAQVFERWLSALKHEFADRILPLTTTEVEAWGRLNAPTPLPVIDGLQAATALVHGLTFVTRNTSHLARTGIPLLDPWSPP
jgi:toxin FitB